MDKTLAIIFALIGDQWELSLIASLFGVFMLYFKAGLFNAKFLIVAWGIPKPGFI